MTIYSATLEYIKENSHSFGQRWFFSFFCWQYFCSTLANDSGTIAQRPIVSPNGQFDVDPASLAQQGMRLQT